MAKGEGVATWSLICGIIAIILGILGGGLGLAFKVCTCFSYPVSVILAIVAIILGIIGLVSGKKSAKARSIIGILLGICYFFLGTVLTILVYLFGGLVAL